MKLCRHWPERRTKGAGKRNGSLDMTGPLRRISAMRQGRRTRPNSRCLPAPGQCLTSKLPGSVRPHADPSRNEVAKPEICTISSKANQNRAPSQGQKHERMRGGQGRPVAVHGWASASGPWQCTASFTADGSSADDRGHLRGRRRGSGSQPEPASSCSASRAMSHFLRCAIRSAASAPFASLTAVRISAFVT